MKLVCKVSGVLENETEYVYECPNGHRSRVYHYYFDEPVVCQSCRKSYCNELDVGSIKESGECIRCDAISHETDEEEYIQKERID